ncbi:MAG: alkaline phosphatase D, partial [Candidatus Azotimanducaceae bacterium]
MDRRQFLIGAMAGIASAHVPRLVASDYQFSRDPFTLGIASGDVSDDAVVLWTRLAPEPLAES